MFQWILLRLGHHYKSTITIESVFSCPGSSIPTPCKDNRQELVDNRQEPVDNRQEPVDNRQEPVDNRQEPVDNRQEPVDNCQEPPPL